MQAGRTGAAVGRKCDLDLDVGVLVAIDPAPPPMRRLSSVSNGNGGKEQGQERYAHRLGVLSEDCGTLVYV